MTKLITGGLAWNGFRMTLALAGVMTPAALFVFIPADNAQMRAISSRTDPVAALVAVFKKRISYCIGRTKPIDGGETRVVKFLKLTSSTLAGLVFGSLMKGTGSIQQTPLEQYQTTFQPLLYGIGF